MITPDELAEVAKLKGLTQANCERDYFQDLVLFNLYRLEGRRLVFKGGTCLYKLYKLNRFSEDLDFTVDKRVDARKALQSALYAISSLGIGVSMKEFSEFQNQVRVRLAFRGPFYRGTKESMLLITLDMSSRERPVREPKREMYLPRYKDLPGFEIFAMDEEEILAEKFRAILERDKARDVYDAWFLMKMKEVKLNRNLLAKKVGKVEEKEIIGKIHEKSGMWEKELKRFIIGTLPSFEQVEREIGQSLK